MSMERPEGYPEVEATETGPSNTGGASFLGTKNDMSLLESGLLRRNYSDVGDNYYRFQSKVGKSVDPKLLALVEFFRELYFRRLELFKKIFPEHHHHNFLDEMPKKVGLVLSRVKSNQTRVRTMQRSMSISSPPEFKRDESEMRLERFKVRTIDLDDGVEQDGKDDKTKQAGGGSK